MRIQSTATQKENLIVDDIDLRLMRRISGTVNDIHTAGEGNYAVCDGDAIIPNLGQCAVNFVNKGHTLTLGIGGGNASALTGVLTGGGTVELEAGPRDSRFRDSPLTLAGEKTNIMRMFRIKQGRVALAKPDGVPAVRGQIIVGGQGDNDCLCWAANDQIGQCSTMELLDSPHGGAYLDLNGHSEKRLFALNMAAHTRIVTGGGILRVRQLTVEGREIPTGVYAGEPWCRGAGMVLVGDVRRARRFGQCYRDVCPAQRASADRTHGPPS